MAINQGTETVEVTTQERTWRINIETAKGADPIVTAYREIIKTGPGGVIISKELVGSVERSLSAVAGQIFTIGGQSYTSAEIATVIAVIADIWREEDLTSQE